jgi:hypothetical protein
MACPRGAAFALGAGEVAVYERIIIEGPRSSVSG